MNYKSVLRYKNLKTRISLSNWILIYNLLWNLVVNELTVSNSLKLFELNKNIGLKVLVIALGFWEHTTTIHLIAIAVNENLVEVRFEC